jgi:hypothetical protein
VITRRKAISHCEREDAKTATMVVIPAERASTVQITTKWSRTWAEIKVKWGIFSSRIRRAAQFSLFVAGEWRVERARENIRLWNKNQKRRREKLEECGFEWKTWKINFFGINTLKRRRKTRREERTMNGGGSLSNIIIRPNPIPITVVIIIIVLNSAIKSHALCSPSRSIKGY